MTQLDEVFSQEAFQTLTADEKESYRQLLLDLQGKSPAESLQIIMKNANKLPQKTLTSAEQTAMVTALMATLSDADRAKFESVLKMMEMMKR